MCCTRRGQYRIFRGDKRVEEPVRFRVRNVHNVVLINYIFVHTGLSHGKYSLNISYYNCLSRTLVVFQTDD